MATNTAGTTGIPMHRKSLSKTALPALLNAAAPKIQVYSDVSLGNSRQPANQATSIRSIAWSPLGSLIATADLKILRVWNPDRNSMKYSTELKLNTQALNATRHNPAPGRVTQTERVAWNPTRESELASLGLDGMLRFWDVRARSPMIAETKVADDGLSLEWHPRGEEIIIGTQNDDLIRFSRQKLKPMESRQQSLRTYNFAFSNSGREILLPTSDGRVTIADYPSMGSIHHLQGHTSSCNVVKQCPKGRHIAIGGSDALMTIWDTTDFTCKHSITEVGGPVRSLSFSFDGSFIVAGGDEPTARKGINVIHVESGQIINTLPSERATPQVSWHPTNYRIAYSGDPLGLQIVSGPGGTVGSL